MKNINKPLFGLGVLISLLSAGLMLNGEILGETTTNIATVLGVTGVCLIGSQRRAIIIGGE